MRQIKKLPSKFQIGDDIVLTLQECDCQNCQVSAAVNEEVPEQIFGQVVSVRFTRAKVFYDILTDDTSEILKDADSSLCSSPYSIEGLTGKLPE